MENWVRGWDWRWVSSFNILLIKKCPGGDIEQAIPVGILEVSCPTFPESRWSSSEGMHRAQQAARGLLTVAWGGFCCRPACGQLVSSLLLAILSAFWTAFLVLLDAWVLVLWAAWSQQQKQEEQGLLLVLFCIWNLKMDFHSVAVWTDSPRQLCSADALSLQKGLTSVAYGGKPGFGVGGGGTETWDNARYKADCGDSSIAHITLPCQGKAAIPTPKP